MNYPYWVNFNQVSILINSITISRYPYWVNYNLVSRLIDSITITRYTSRGMKLVTEVPILFSHRPPTRGIDVYTCLTKVAFGVIHIHQSLFCKRECAKVHRAPVTAWLIWNRGAYVSGGLKIGTCFVYSFVALDVIVYTPCYVYCTRCVFTRLLGLWTVCTHFGTV